MSLGLNGWDMDDVHKEMRNKTLFEILQLFSAKKGTIATKATEYIQAISDGSEKAKERLEKEILHLEKEKCVIALQIAEALTNVTKE